jgi:hypothetical protein
MMAVLPSVPNCQPSAFRLQSWACGAAGSALPWHGRGRRFGPDQIHQISAVHARCQSRLHSLLFLLYALSATAPSQRQYVLGDAPCSRNICAKNQMFAGKVTCGVPNETSGRVGRQVLLPRTRSQDKTGIQTQQRCPAQTSGRLAAKDFVPSVSNASLTIGMAERRVLSSLPFPPITIDKGPSAAAMVVELLGFADR